MPFGVKPDGEGGSVDFDAVYERLLVPAICAAELEPLRADQDVVGGMIHKPMFERLILADYAVVDLTTANANVFYELGVRHAARPFSTVLVSADVKRAPFDLAPDRVLPYALDHDGGPADPAKDIEVLASALRAARAAATDSPVFQLIDELPTPQIDRLKTDVFRDQAAYSAEVKSRLAAARADGVAALREVEHDLGPLEDVEAGVLVDLLLSFRAAKGWEEMIRLVEAMPEPVRRTALVREQYGFALNRAQRSADAERVLLDVIEDRGPSSETLGLLGRVYKDRWEAEREGLGAARRRPPRPGDRRLPPRFRGRLARCVSGHQRGHADGDPRPGRRGTAGCCCRWSATPTAAGWMGAEPTTGITRRGWSSG